MEVIEEVFFEKKIQLEKVERYWIDQFRQWGFLLKNTRFNLSIREVYNENGFWRYGESYLDLYMTGKEVCKTLGINFRTLGKMRDAGQLKFYVLADGKTVYRKPQVLKIANKKLLQ